MFLNIFDYLPIWSLYIILSIVSLLAFELGYKISKRTSLGNDKDTFDSVGPMVGGLLAMLAFFFNSRLQIIENEPLLAI